MRGLETEDTPSDVEGEEMELTVDREGNLLFTEFAILTLFVESDGTLATGIGDIE